jgi:hypothetical protein
MVPVPARWMIRTRQWVRVSGEEGRRDGRQARRHSTLFVVSPSEYGGTGYEVARNSYDHLVMCRTCGRDTCIHADAIREYHKQPLDLDAHPQPRGLAP